MCVAPPPLEVEGWGFKATVNGRSRAVLALGGEPSDRGAAEHWLACAMMTGQQKPRGRRKGRSSTIYHINGFCVDMLVQRAWCKNLFFFLSFFFLHT